MSEKEKIHDGCGHTVIGPCVASIFAESKCEEPPIRLEEDVWVCGKHADEFGYTWKSKD